MKRIFTGGGSTRPVPGLGRDASKSSGDSSEDGATNGTDHKDSVDDTAKLQPRKSDSTVQLRSNGNSQTQRKESAASGGNSIDEYYDRRRTLPLNSKDSFGATFAPSSFGGPYSTSTYIGNPEQFVPDDLFIFRRASNMDQDSRGHLVMMVAPQQQSHPSPYEQNSVPKLFRSAVNLVLNQPKQQQQQQQQANPND